MRITFVHIVDPTLYEPGTAALIGLARALGAEVTRLPADFGSRQEDLMNAIVGSRPDLVVMRLSAEVREAVGHAVGKLGELAPEILLAFQGPLVQAFPDLVLDLSPRALLLLGDPEIGLAGLLAQNDLQATLTAPPSGVISVVDGAPRPGPEAGPADVGLAPPPAYDLFEPGMSRSAVGASLFGEPGSLPLETTIGSPSGPSGNAALAGFNHPTSHAPRLLPIASIVRRADLLRPRARTFEIVDREFGFAGSHYGEVLAALDRIAGHCDVTLRMLASNAPEAIVRETVPGRVRRIVCELDSTGGEAARLPGVQDVACVGPFLEFARARGFEIGLLVSAGLPGESAEDLRRKIDFVRGLAPDVLRFLPFTPLFGHPWRRVAEEGAMMPTGDASWNREVYVPLRQAIMPEETWYLLWQDCLDLQARVQLRRQWPALEIGG